MNIFNEHIYSSTSSTLFTVFIFYRAPSKCVNLLTHGNNCKLNKERHCCILLFYIINIYKIFLLYSLYLMLVNFTFTVLIFRMQNLPYLILFVSKFGYNQIKIRRSLFIIKLFRVYILNSNLDTQMENFIKL